MIDINDKFKIPDYELRFTFVRSSGPGGQNVNKTSSCAVLHWNLRYSPSVPEHLKGRIAKKLGKRINLEGELVLRSDRFRDRERNIADCLEKLKELLVQASHVPKKRVATKPTKASKKKRLETKRKHSEKKKYRGKISEA